MRLPGTIRRDYSLDTLGYHAATEHRRSPGAVPQGGSGDFHLRLDRATLVKISRAYERDNALFQGLHRVSRDNILGSGFGLMVKTRSKRWNEKREAIWREEFSEAPEIRGLFKWHQVEQLALDGMMVAGDFGAIKLGGRNWAVAGRLQLIESEQIDAGRTQPAKGNRIQDGIELDKYGRIVKFYVKDFAPKSATSRGRARGLDPDDFVFPAFRRRPSQTRGIPALVASFPDINRLDDILSSEAASWQLLSRLAVKRKQLDAADMAYAGSKADENKTVQTEDLAKRVHDVGTALFFNCEPGEDIESIKHDIPGPNFEVSVRVFLRMLGLPLGLPLELSILDWSETNYSSARAALEQAFLNFLRWQMLLSESWHDPIYEWRTRLLIAQGRLEDRADAFRHEWNRPEFPWLDQLKEAQAWGLKLDRGLATHSQALKSVNRDRVEWLEIREREVTEAMEIADRIQKGRAKADPDLWKHFCGLGLKAKTNVSKKGESTPAAEGPETGDDEAPDGVREILHA